MLARVAFFTEVAFARALVMPNLPTPVLSGEDALAYKADIVKVAEKLDPLMTIKLIGKTNRETILHARDVGVIAGKVYPEGVTTNSADGVRDIRDLYPIFETMEACGMVLSLHGEDPNAFCLDREVAFLNYLEDISEAFPRLKIVLEHVTTARAVDMVKQLPNVAATITVHHLLITLDDVLGGPLRPHLFCKPIAKRPSDRQALNQAAISGNPKFFLGTDSAPHVIGLKECASGCAGVFSAPVAMEVLAEVFEDLKALDKLEAFTSEYGAKFYGLPLNEGTITLNQEEWTVPEFYGPVVPFKAKETLRWKLAE